MSSPNGDVAKRLVDGVFISVIGFPPKSETVVAGCEAKVAVSLLSEPIRS
jgi:hypothetical protein